ncbi:MAG: hypothetical protein WCI72_06140 [archaeon]
MEERQVYISFETPDYKLNKTSLLMCKAEIIQLQKRLTNLHALRSHKKRLLANLSKLTSSTEFIVQRLDEKMPDPTMPRHIKNKFSKRVEKAKQKFLAPKPPKEKSIEEDFDVSNLDRELLELNKRIKELS